MRRNREVSSGLRMSEPPVSINVPCYRQLHHARLAVDSILAQSFPDFEVTLLDDGASDEYRDYVEALGDSRVRYRRNPERLGAMRNMFAAIEGGPGQYTLAFHEDDLLERDYLSAAVDILESHPTAALWPASCGNSAPSRRPSCATNPTASGLRLVRIRRGFRARDSSRVEPMFGSVVYRRSAIAGVHPSHSRLRDARRPSVSALDSQDNGRPRSFASRWSGIVITRRRHASSRHEHRSRSGALKTYRALLPKAWDKRDRALFFSYTGYWLVELYRLTPPIARPGAAVPVSGLA